MYGPLDYFTDFPTTWGQYKTQAFISQLPIIGSWYRYRDENRYLMDYYRNNPYAGFPRYPSKTGLWSASGGMSGSVVHYVSKSIDRLYDD